MGFCSCEERNNEVVRHEASIVAQGFTQRSVIVYDEICSPIMSEITFRYLISLAVNNEFVYPTDGCCDYIVVWVT